MTLYSAGAQCDLDIVLLGNHVQVNNEQRASAAITEELVSDLKIQMLYVYCDQTCEVVYVQENNPLTCFHPVCMYAFISGRKTFLYTWYKISLKHQFFLP